MTGHVVFVGLALVLCTAVPSANTTANADSNPEIIVGTEDVIIVRNIASTHSSKETSRKSFPYYTVTSTELPVPVKSSTTESSAAIMQTADETRALTTMATRSSAATETTTEVATTLQSLETTTSTQALSTEVSDKPVTTMSWWSQASLSNVTPESETSTNGHSTLASAQVSTETAPTTVSEVTSPTPTEASPTRTTTTTTTTPSSTTPAVRLSPAGTTFTSSPSSTTAIPSSVPSEIVQTHVSSTVASTTTTSTESPSSSRGSALPTVDDSSTAATTSAFTTTFSSKSESAGFPMTTPMPQSVVTGFRRTVTRLGASTALPSTVTQLLQMHKTQELLRQAAVVARIRQRYTAAMRVFYQNGNSEADLPECSAMQVCNKVDVYSTPWVERQCRCPARTTCSKSVDSTDGHTVTDKSRLYKTCEPVKKLPECRFFRDATWTIEQTASNHTRQTLHCTCPKNAVAYLAKYELVPNVSGVNFKYSFACSPQVRQKCQPAEPCRLFTVKKRRVVDEVNSDTLCDCPAQQWCPSHHTDSSISPGSFFKEDHLKIFTGFCQPVA